MTPIEPKPKRQIKKTPKTVSVRRKSAGLLSHKTSPDPTPVETPTPVVDEVQHHTPTRLVELWKERWPVLNLFHNCRVSAWPQSITPTSECAESSGYCVFMPEAQNISGGKTDYTNPVPAYKASLWPAEFRVFRQRFDNQYYFGQAVFSFAERHATQMGTPVAFEELQLRHGTKLLVDARTKLFALLHGWFEIHLGGDPEFFPIYESDLPPLVKAAFTPSYFTRDGLAWELHTQPGVRCANNFLTHVQGYMTKFCRDFAELSPKPRLDLSQALLAKLSPEALELGCNPSDNVYGLFGDLGTAKYLNKRWAGGHMHFGLPPAYCDNYEVITRCVKNVDALAGVFMVHLVGPWDCPERRLYYGQAGEFRSKPYGFEWRTPSNQIWRNSLLMYFMIEIARMAIKMALAGLSYEDVDFKTTEAEVIAAIQENNVELATAIVHRNMALYWSIFNSRSNYNINSKAIGEFLYLGNKHPQVRACNQPGIRELWVTRPQINTYGPCGSGLDLTPYEEPNE